MHPPSEAKALYGLELVADLAEHRRTEREEQPAAQPPRQEDPHDDHDSTAEPRPLPRTEGATPVAAARGHRADAGRGPQIAVWIKDARDWCCTSLPTWRPIPCPRSHLS